MEQLPRGIAETSDLRDTFERALHTGTRIVENRVRLLALDAREEMRALGRGSLMLAAAGVSATLAWIALVGAFGAFLWTRAPAVTVFAVISALHALAAAGLLLAGRERIETARRENRAAREEREGAANGP